MWFLVGAELAAESLHGPVLSHPRPRDSATPSASWQDLVRASMCPFHDELIYGPSRYKVAHMPTYWELSPRW